MGALKIFGIFGYAHGYFSPNFSWVLVLIDPMNVRTKLPVPGIIGVPIKFGQSLNMPTLSFLQNF